MTNDFAFDKALKASRSYLSGCTPVCSIRGAP